MKRIVAITLTMLMLTMSIALAEIPDISGLTREELGELKLAVETRIAELDVAEAGEETTETEEAETEANYETLQKGSKGDAVKKLQQRLIELNYLSGGADGDYGNKTANAVSAFQKAAGLQQNGVADAATQEALYASDAPVQKVYGTIKYKDLARDPDKYEGQACKFSGKVLQVMEDNSYADVLGVYTVLRVATYNNYDNVIYVTYWRPKSGSRILEDDRVTVYGVSGGLYTYESTTGREVTIPLIEADMIQ